MKIQLFVLAIIILNVSGYKCPGEEVVIEKPNDFGSYLIDYNHVVNLDVGDGVYCEVVEQTPIDDVCKNSTEKTNDLVTAHGLAFGNFYELKEKIFRFKVKTHYYAVIGFFPGKVNVNPKVEVILDSASKIHSVISINDVEKATSKLKNLLNKDEYRSFWIKWSENRMEVGREGDSKPFLISDLPFDPKYLSLRTPHSKGEWKFEDIDKQSFTTNIKHAAKVKCYKQNSENDSCSLNSIKLYKSLLASLKSDKEKFELRKRHTKLSVNNQLKELKELYLNSKNLMVKIKTELVEKGMKCDKIKNITNEIRATYAAFEKIVLDKQKSLAL